MSELTTATTFQDRMFERVRGRGRRIAIRMAVAGGVTQVVMSLCRAGASASSLTTLALLTGVLIGPYPCQPHWR